jgi:RNA polymerase sigma-70 factor (ECF subfamily)
VWRLLGVTTATDYGLRWTPAQDRRGGSVVVRTVPAPSDARARSAEEGVREVYDANFGRLAGWATRLVSDPDLGHDFATEAFVRLIGHWGAVDEPRAWLYATVANQVRDHWRKRGREATAYRKVQGHLAPDVAVEPAVDQATSLTVRGAVEALPERLRMAVLLHYFADLSVAQVAQQMGKSEGTIKRDLYDARARIALMLGER